MNGTSTYQQSKYLSFIYLYRSSSYLSSVPRKEAERMVSENCKIDSLMVRKRVMRKMAKYEAWLEILLLSTWNPVSLTGSPFLRSIQVRAEKYLDGGGQPIALAPVFYEFVQMRQKGFHYYNISGRSLSLNSNIMSINYDLSFDQKSSQVFEVDQDHASVCINEFAEKWNTKIEVLKQNIYEIQHKKEDLMSVLQRAESVLKKRAPGKENDVNAQNLPPQTQPKDLKESINHLLNETLSIQEFQQPIVNIPQKPIAQFLMQIELSDEYLQHFIDLGVYDNLTLHNVLNLQDKQSKLALLLYKFGIDKIGHRKRILAMLDEEQALFQRKGLLQLPRYYDQIIDIEDWLAQIKKPALLPAFELAGLDDVPYLVYLQQSTWKITDSDLKDYLFLEDENERQIILAHIVILSENVSNADLWLRQESLRNTPDQLSIQCGLAKGQNCLIF